MKQIKRTLDVFLVEYNGEQKYILSDYVTEGMMVLSNKTVTAIVDAQDFLDLWQATNPEKF